MIKNRLIIVLFLILCLYQTSGQELKTYFKILDSILMKENSSEKLFLKLDSFKSNFIPSRSGLAKSFDRDVDFGYKHERISISINLKEYQIDLLKRNDSIFVKSIKDYKHPFSSDSAIEYFNASSVKYLDYLNLRNQFYKSNKSIANLINELGKVEVYAFTCGLNNIETKMGIHVKNLVKHKNVIALSDLLKSVCTETQAFAIKAFEMLDQMGYPIDPFIKNIIAYLKKRNSEVVECWGCIIYEAKKIY